MLEVSIQPQWSIRRTGQPTLPPRLVQLLGDVHEHGSLLRACEASGASYRHAWQLLREAEAALGQPLIRTERGQGSKLTVLGQKLLWADRRIAARLSPLLHTLASELEVELGRVMAPEDATLRLHASHGFAIEKLDEFLRAGQVPVELKYCGSQEAVASLAAGNCDVAGFHMPLGSFEPSALAHYARWFKPHEQAVVHVATRKQGLIVAPGNPKKLYAPADLARPGVRFINRQPTSGTRFLLDLMLQRDGVDPARIDGYARAEYTHAAVAAYVASGMADVGFGVEPPARRFGLEFIPLETERYLLLCDARSLPGPRLQALLGVLRSAPFRAAVDQLPGYDAQDIGSLVDVDALLGPAPPAVAVAAAPARTRQARR